MVPTFVYVISPDYETEAYVSILTLIRSGATVDRIVVYCIGLEGEVRSLSQLANVEVRYVDTLSEELFLINKAYVGEVVGEVVVLVDSDTIFVNSPDNTLSGVDWDVRARVESSHLRWESWRKLCREIGVGRTPYVNTGFVAFRNGANQHLREEWIRLFGTVTEKVKRSPEKGPHYGDNFRWAEQMAFSLALGERARALKEMDQRDHVFGWVTTPAECDLENTVLFHAGRNKLFRSLAEIEGEGYVDTTYRGLRELRRFHHATSRLYYHSNRAKVKGKEVVSTLMGSFS
mgnify:CR=1 FL=1